MEALIGATGATDATKPVFSVPVSRLFGSLDVSPLANDIVRMICIQLAIQIMVALSDSSGVGAVFTVEFILLLVYIVLGAMLYWLAIRHIVTFV